MTSATRSRSRSTARRACSRCRHEGRPLRRRDAGDRRDTGVAGLTPALFEAMAEVYEGIARSSIAAEAPEAIPSEPKPRRRPRCDRSPLSPGRTVRRGCDSAGERTRTSKGRSPPGPKPGASASSATPAQPKNRAEPGIARRLAESLVLQTSRIQFSNREVYCQIMRGSCGWDRGHPGGVSKLRENKGESAASTSAGLRDDVGRLARL